MAKEGAASNSGDTTLDIDNFEWSDGDFFGIAPETTTQEVQEKVIRSVKATTSEEEPDKPKGKKKEDEQSGSESESEDKYTWFDDKTTKGTDKESKGKGTETKGSSDTRDKGAAGDEVEDEDDDLEDKTKKDKSKENEGATSGEEDDDITFYTTLAKELKDKKIFSGDLFKDDDEIDEEKFFELHDAEIETRAGEIFDEFIEKTNADDDAKAFIIFKKNGGDTAQFFQAYKQASGLPDNLDTSKAGDQKKILTFYYLNVEEVEPDDLEEKLEFVTEKGKSEEYAKKYYQKILDKQKQIRDSVTKDQEKAREDAITKAKANKVALQTILDTGKGVEGITFNDKDKKTLVDLATKPVIKVGTNRYITQAQSLLGDVMKDPTKFLSLLKFLNEGMKFPEIEKATTTKVVNKVKNSLRESRINKGLVNTGTNKGDKDLTDFFPD